MRDRKEENKSFRNIRLGMKSLASRNFRHSKLEKRPIVLASVSLKQTKEGGQGEVISKKSRM